MSKKKNAKEARFRSFQKHVACEISNVKETAKDQQTSTQAVATSENENEEDQEWTEEEYMKVFGEFEPTFTDSDVEREESLKVSVPTLPHFVSLQRESKSIRKIRRVRTAMDGLLVYNGNRCVYWPAVHELPKEYPVKELLRRVCDDGDREYYRVIELYEKYYTLWHLYGVFCIYVNDNDDLVNNFKELLNDRIYVVSRNMYGGGIFPGFGNSWKADMIRYAKYQEPGPTAPLKLKTAKLLKKPFIEVKYKEGRGRTDRVGPWKDDPESDPESRASPPRYRR